MAEYHQHNYFQPELREEAARLYAELGSLSRVGAVMGISKQRVHVLLRETDVKINPPGKRKA